MSAKILTAEFVPFVSVGPRNRQKGDPVLHSCPAPEACEVPAWWEDHCEVYALLLRAQELRGSLLGLAEPVMLDAINTVASNTPGWKPAKARKALLASKSAAQWLGAAITTGTAPNIVQFARAAATEASGQQAHIAWGPEGASTRCRHTKSHHLSPGWKFTCATHSHIQEVAHLEAVLCSYYLPRMRSISHSFVRKNILDPHEKLLLDGDAGVVLLEVIRTYRPTSQVPVQQFMLLRGQQRLQDELRSMRPGARRRARTETRIFAKQQEDPTLTWLQAAEACGVTADEIVELRTQRSTSRLDSVWEVADVARSGREFETPEDLFLHALDVDPVDARVCEVAQAFASSLPARDREAMMAHRRGELGEWLDVMRVSTPQKRAEWYTHVGHLVTAFEDALEAAGRARTPADFDARAWIRAASKETLQSLARAAKDGTLQTWAKEVDMPTSRAQALALMLRTMQEERDAEFRRLAMAGRGEELRAWAVARGLQPEVVLARARALSQRSRRADSGK